MSIWTLDDPWIPSNMKGKKIRLITPDELHQLPAGTKLVAIDGKEVVVGTHSIDEDTRFGYLAFGFLID